MELNKYHNDTILDNRSESKQKYEKHNGVIYEVTEEVVYEIELDDDQDILKSNADVCVQTNKHKDKLNKTEVVESKEILSMKEKISEDQSCQPHFYKLRSRYLDGIASKPIFNNKGNFNYK